MLRLKTLREKKEIKLGIYPYTYVRTTVMKSLLLKRDDYSKMLKMGFSEIANFLQNSSYKKEINALGNEYRGADLLELALNRNLSETFKKLARISSNELGLLIREYILRKDIEDLKTILRGKLTGTDEKSIINSITAAGTLSRNFFSYLLKKESVEEILKGNVIVDFSLLEKGLKELKEKNSLVGIENAFDKFYYSHLLQFSKLLPKEGALFRRFLLQEVEILNILTLLRLKKAKFSKDALKEFIILSGDKQIDSRITRLFDIEDFGEILKLLEKKDYKNLIASGVDEFKKTGSLIALETEFYKFLLRQSSLFMHQHPLSVDVILGYMLAKDIEVRNIRLIVKGKQLGLKEEFIESQIVY